MANPQAQLQQAVALHRAGQLAQAEELYRAALKKMPGNADILNMLGLVVAGLGRTEEGAGCLQKAVKKKPSDPGIHYNLANLLRATGRMPDAAESYRKSLALRESNPEAWYGLACALEQMRDVDATREAAGRALEQNPRHAMAAVVLARAERSAGDAAAATERLRTLSARQDLAPIERTHTLVELGKTLDRLGDYTGAWEAFEGGQQALMATPEFNRTRPEMFRAMVDASMHIITPERLAEWGREEWNDGLPDPVYLVGFPRSGTTLVENILAAHSKCITTDERPFTQNIIRALPGMVGLDYPNAVELLNSDQIRVLRRQYWDQVEQFTGEQAGSRTLIDKQPMNLAYTGLLVRLFPGAKMIVVRRDPRDVCLSCFMQAFTPNQAMSNFCTLESTVALYDRLMSFWTGIESSVPLPRHEVVYEQAVGDLEGTARGLIGFLGLDWEPDVLRFNERVGDRYIQTPSYEAVSRPVYTSAIGRWRHYAEALEPHREVLDRHAAREETNEERGSS